MTAQIPDRLILDGLERDLTAWPWMPEDHPQIVETDPRALDLEGDDALVLSSACWRNYIATWTLVESHLSLIAIRGRFALAGDAPVHAEWFSGVIRMPEGGLFEYVHSHFGTLFSRERHLVIQAGVVIDSRTVDYRDGSIPLAELGATPARAAALRSRAWYVKACGGLIFLLARRTNPREIIRWVADHPADLPALLDRALTDPSPLVRRRYARALAWVPPNVSPGGVEAALGYLMRDSDESVRLGALEALALRERSEQNEPVSALAARPLTATP